MTTILTKIKHKAILIEYIQGFVSTRRYILPFLINKDKILLNQLKIFNDILEDNTLSSNFMNNLFSFISDRILFRIISEVNVMNDSLYVPEEKEENIFQKIKKRILNIYKNKKIYKETTISINKLKKYIPNEKEFVLFIMDFLENKNQISLIFPEFNLQKGKNYIINFNSYYEKNKILFEKEAQLFNNDAKSEYDKINRKIIINVAFIGNKNSGKSTTVGHLLYNTGNIEPNIFNEAINTTNAFGISSYKYSWLLDRIWDERTYRKTVIPHIKKFETEKYYFNLIDLPGDFKLKKNIIKGLSLAEVAVIIVEADNEINDIIGNGHIKDYLIFAFTMGIRQIIIAVNKMDKTKDSKYSENVFIKIKINMINLCINIGFNINNIQVIAYSGYTGQNLVNKYEDDDFSNTNKMEWYKGKTLIESLDELKPPKRTFDGPLIISIFQKDKITGCGTVLEGKILSGKLDKEIVLCIPKLVNTQIEKKTISWIEMNREVCDEAFAGDIIGLNTKGAIRDIYFTYLVFDEKLMTKFKIAKNLRVKILMINKDTKLKIGSVLTLFCYTLNVPIKIIKIEYLVDETNKILEKEPREIKNGERAFIIINVIIKEKEYYWGWKKKLSQLSYFEKYTKNQNLGSFILCNRDLIAVGNIYDINVET